jgi:predicted double-glycine peptidase
MSFLKKMQAGFGSLAFFLSFLLLSNVHAEDFDKDVLFKGIDSQIHDYSCGTAALATLISGLYENIEEQKVIDVIFDSEEAKNAGYTASQLESAAKKLGFNAEWRKISPDILPKIKQPVILLIGLNSDFAHYVVFKGIDNNEAFLADPIRGNIRIPYQDLIKEGINENYAKWYVMAIQSSAEQNTSSNLFLNADKFKTHATVEQSNAITLATVAKENQLMMTYDFGTTLGRTRYPNLLSESRNFTHSLGLRYGVTENVEIGGNFAYSDYRQKISAEENTAISKNFDRAYDIYVNRRFSLDDAGQYGVILGGRTSFAEYASIWGGGVNLMGFMNSSFAQFVAGTSVNKQFSNNQAVDNNLPEYQVVSFVNANKPIGDRFLGSLSFSVIDGNNKNSEAVAFKKSFNASTGLTCVFDNRFQITPSLGYVFGNGEFFTFGASISYVGGW